MSAGSARAPLALVPQANSLTTGSTRVTRPASNSFSRRTLAWTMGFSHMFTFMAGAITRGVAGGRASRVAAARSSPRPQAARARKSALAGATSTRSAHSPSRMWGMEPTIRSSSTGLPDRVSKLMGVTKAVAAGVMTTLVSTPLAFSSRITSSTL